MKQGEKSWDLRGVGVAQWEEREKKSEKCVFILYKGNIKIMNKWATVTM